MKVYIVYEKYDGRIEEIFATEEGAKEYCKGNYNVFYDAHYVQE